ncbi:hypothetical protein A9Q94_12290 [Rhodobacterales bacterium 56_14_T64]|nr:hypothetical protein A9Q94_12290 [Rhodobacterales bacterium 56_14_T64]
MSQHLDGMNLIDLLDQLHPMAPPPAISMVPQTLGWLAVLVVLATTTAWAAHRRWRHWRDNAYRRAALTELDQLSDDPTKIAILLRRTALSAFPRPTVAALRGAAWLDFLDSSYGGHGFSQGADHVLTTAPYRTEPPANPDLTALARQWLRQHRRPQC